MKHTNAEHDPLSRPPGFEHVAPVTPETAEVKSAEQAVEQARNTVDAIEEHAKKFGGNVDTELADFTKDSEVSEDPRDVEAGALTAFDAVLVDVHEGHDPRVDFPSTLAVLGSEAPEVVANGAHTELMAGATDEEIEEALERIPHEFAQRSDHQHDSRSIDLKESFNNFADDNEMSGNDVLSQSHNAETESPKRVSLSEKIMDSAEGLHERVDNALERCNFVRSPEIEKAVEGFYGDHRKLQATIEAVTAGLSEEDKRSIESGEFRCGNFVIDNAVQRLAAIDTSTPEGRSGQLQSADEIVSKVLFNENAVGATVLEENEVQAVPQLHHQIREQAQREGLLLEGTDSWKNGVQDSDGIVRKGKKLAEQYMIEGEVRNRRLLKDTINRDTRYAGQLEFHNTPFMDEVARGIDGKSFTLTSRSGRVSRGLDLRHTTGEAGDAVGGAHSNLVHFSEKYTPLHYKYAVNLSEQRMPGTLAAPLADIIEQAPFARDSQYSVETVKPDIETPDAPINDVVLFEGNSGGRDMRGEAGNDRIFLADYRDSHQDQAHNYALTFSGERANRAKIILTQDDVGRLGGNVIAPFGAGEGYPETVVVDFDNDRYGESKEVLSEKIRQLNNESIARPEYRDKRVVPLRSGVMEFQYESWQTIDNHLRRPNTANRLAASLSR